MPQNQSWDFALAASGQPFHGFMLVRSGQMRGRAWKKSGVPISAGSPFPEEERFESQQVPTEVAFVDVFDDFSGGYGYAYKRPPLPYRYIPVIAREMADPNVYHYAENFDARFQNQLVHAQAMVDASLYDDIDNNNPGGLEWMIDLPMTAPVPPIGFGQVFLYGRRQNLVGDRDSWVAAQRNAFPPALDATARTTTTRKGLEGPPAIFGSFCYVGGASGPFMRFDLNGQNGTQGQSFFINPGGTGNGLTATIGPIDAQGFVAAGNRMWAKVGPRSQPTYLTSVAAGAASGNNDLAMAFTNWGVLYPVGNQQRPIGPMKALAGQVFVGLADGIYAGDTSGSFLPVTGELAQQANQDNFRDLCIHDGTVVGQHVSGVFAYDPTNTAVARVRQIGPVQRTNRSPVTGFVTAVESFGGWLYGGLFNGSQSYVVAGRDTKGAGPFEWHVMQRLPVNGRVSRIHFDGLTTYSGVPPVGAPNRLWVGMEATYGAMMGAPGGSGNAPVYFVPVPRAGGNPLVQDPNFSANYAGSAQMFLPSVDRGAPGIQKVYERVEVWADALQATTRYLNVYMSIDRGARTLVGSANTSPVTVIPLGSSNGYWPAGKSYELSFDSFTTTPGSCHVIRSINVYGKMRPRVVDTVTAVVKIADDMTDRQNTPMRPAAVQIDDLRSYADPTRLGGVPIQLIDLAGATSWVLVQAPIQESETYEQGSQNPEIAATVQMVVMNLSAA